MVLAFIPVRGGSKSIPLKNIKPFCGKPLVYWTAKALEDTKVIDKIIVATDSDIIEQVISQFNLKKVEIYRRLPENANDNSTTESVMLEYIENAKISEKDIFMLVQATSPLTTSNDIEKALNIYHNDNYDSILSCVRNLRFFWNEDGTSQNYDYKNRPRRQDFTGNLMENGALYLNSVKNIKQSKNRLSGKIGIVEMPCYTATEIDEPEDWIMAENLMHKYVLEKENNPNIRLFLSDVDGTLTDAGMYYDSNGNELKKFNTHDGKGFELLKKAGIKTGIITSENTSIVTNRAKKLKVDYLYQGLEHKGKLEIAKEICKKEEITLSQVAYIGDDINCKELLENVGLAACPANAVDEIKQIPNILKLAKCGGDGAVREFVERVLK